MPTDSDRSVQDLAREIQRDLYKTTGPLLFGEKLYTALGFPSGDAFRQALSRSNIPAEVFSLPNRRGKFALSRDVALWLATQRLHKE